MTYRQLVDEYKFGRKGMVVQWMEDAERTLMENREIRRRNGSAYDAITLSVFSWTCGHMQVRQPYRLGRRELTSHAHAEQEEDQHYDSPWPV